MAACGGTEPRTATHELTQREKALDEAAFQERGLKLELAELAGLVKNLEAAIVYMRRTGKTDWCGVDLHDLRERPDTRALSLAPQIEALRLPAFEEAILAVPRPLNAGETEELTRMRRTLERARRTLRDLTLRAERGYEAVSAIC